VARQAGLGCAGSVRSGVEVSGVDLDAPEHDLCSATMARDRCRIRELESHRVVWRRHALRRWDVIVEAHGLMVNGKPDEAMRVLAEEVVRTPSDTQHKCKAVDGG
jgi:hypothetical protein